MPRTLRFGSAVSAVAIAAMLGGCATPLSRSVALGSGKGGQSKLAFATRAQVAIASGDFETAVTLAEQAVENSPSDATLRGLLANAYFGAGRFASAEAAYRDSLTLQGNQPQLVLKLALVQIAQGKNGEAIAALEAARGFLDPADHGLALALAGQAGEAVLMLEQAARVPGADARIRQNLALAYGLSGDWTAARTVAEQDLSPDLVDSRVQQWMALATPVRASDQVAALVGVAPAAADPGQPVRLALRQSDEVRVALRQPEDVHPSLGQPEPIPVAQPPVLAPLALAPEPPVQLVEQLAAAPLGTSSALPPLPELAQPTEPAPVYQPQALTAAFAESAAADVASAAESAPVVPDSNPPPPLVAALAPSVQPPKPAVHRTPELRSGNAGVVVQLGAYSSRARVQAAWEQFADRYGALRDYAPVSAHFEGPKGKVYRLSVKGFATLREASSLCSTLRGQGQSCFVRRVAGDAPVQFASR